MTEGDYGSGRRDACQDFLRDIPTYDGQEFIFVLQGRMEVRPGEGNHILDPGDAIYYDSTVPHLVKCLSDRTTKIPAILYAEG